MREAFYIDIERRKQTQLEREYGQSSFHSYGRAAC